MDMYKQLADELSIRPEQAEAAVGLIDEGNTIPFISRYRKEVTGGLDDEILRKLGERLTYLRNLEEKKGQVLHSIEEQGKLTEELKAKIEAALTMVAVDDLYRPYRPKKRTRATIAKEKGLEPLADLLFAQEMTGSLAQAAGPYVDESKGVASVEEALAGARDIIAERISDMADYRKSIRNVTMKMGTLEVKAKDEKAESVYEMYYDFSANLLGMPGHRILAINRGEKEKFLTVKVEAPKLQIISALGRSLITSTNQELVDLLKETVEDSYLRLIAPSIERDIRNELTEKAEDGAIIVFGKNLKQLLLQPPIKGHRVLGWDPGYAHGCKLAVVDETGKVLDTAIVYPTIPHNKVAQTKRIVGDMIKKHRVTLISCGNGTASRESEQVINEIIHETPQKVAYIITNEAGASVYSASKLAAEEFPNLTVEERGAASIARRVQDPLAELVKIESKAIGVGQYQHDMNQKKLEATLDGVVEDCVNKVGVDLNTASVALLSYVSGISKAVAKNIVAYREENGSFASRKELLKVPKLGPKAFLQCAGFLRILDGSNPLDNTSVHPESYEAAKALIRKLGLDESQLKRGGFGSLKGKVKNITALSEELGIGVMTLEDIIDELEKPGRDPRSDMPAPILRTDVLAMEDLKEGMVLKGTVRNVIDFGAFVDIGVHQDGLVHISQMCDRFIKHPLEVVSVGDVVDVKVMSVDLKKKRIQLTMKL